MSSNKENLQALVKAGLTLVISEMIEILPETRRTCKTNDVVVIAFCDPDGLARLYGVRRKAAYESLSDNLPEAKQTLSRLSEPVDPGNFLAVISHEQSLYCMVLPAPLDSPGVVN